MINENLALTQKTPFAFGILNMSDREQEKPFVFL